jgi:hypothetical protein
MCTIIRRQCRRDVGIVSIPLRAGQVARSLVVKQPAGLALPVGPANVSHDKLCGRGLRAEARAARRLPRARPKRQYAICNRRHAVALAMQSCGIRPRRVTLRGQCDINALPGDDRFMLATARTDGRVHHPVLRTSPRYGPEKYACPRPRAEKVASPAVDR